MGWARKGPPWSVFISILIFVVTFRANAITFNATSGQAFVDFVRSLEDTGDNVTVHMSELVDTTNVTIRPFAAGGGSLRWGSLNLLGGAGAGDTIRPSFLNKGWRVDVMVRPDGDLGALSCRILEPPVDSGRAGMLAQSRTCTSSCHPDAQAFLIKSTMQSAEASQCTRCKGLESFCQQHHSHALLCLAAIPRRKRKVLPGGPYCDALLLHSAGSMGEMIPR